MSKYRLASFLAAAALLAPVGSVGGCPGDCDGDGKVRVGELIACASEAMEGLPLRCNIDQNLDGEADVEELVFAVKSSIRGCRSGFTVRVCLADFGEDVCSGATWGTKVELLPLERYYVTDENGGVWFGNVSPGRYTARAGWDCNPFVCWADMPVAVVDRDVSIVLPRIGEPAPFARLVIGSSSATPGSSIEVPVSIEGSFDSVTAASLHILFDSAVMTIEPRLDCRLDPRLEANEQLAVNLRVNPPAPPGFGRLHVTVLFRFDDPEIHEFGDGPLVHCTFHIAADAAPGSYELMGDRPDVIELNSLNVPTDIENGWITVCDGEECP